MWLNPLFFIVVASQVYTGKWAKSPRRVFQHALIMRHHFNVG